MFDDFKFDVIQSHSSKKKDGVHEVAERLRRDGVSMWFDEWQMHPGDSILATIEAGPECVSV
jgi:hypothetical protein